MHIGVDRFQLFDSFYSQYIPHSWTLNFFQELVDDLSRSNCIYRFISDSEILT